MLPLQRRAVLAGSRWIAQRGKHTSGTPVEGPSSAKAQEPLTGAAKLLADAANEEAEESSAMKNRDHLVHTQGPIWTGDESQYDAVLRMLVDAHKPHRTGEGIKPDAADKRIKKWMKNLDMSPRVPVTRAEQQEPTEQQLDSPHHSKIPPHLWQPWHATYTGQSEAMTASPKIKYGTFERSKIDPDRLYSDLELRLERDARGAARKNVLDKRQAARLRGRLDRAREGAIDYRLGINDGDLTNVGSSADVDNMDESEQPFRGNRQLRGMSVLGAQRGSGSGMRAWGGLVEDRIQRAKDAGLFNYTQGKGAPIAADPAEKNPHLELGEVFMNRIIKRQGALPPWIEMQNNLDATHSSFRAMLLETYTRHLVRAVISTNALHPLPPLHAIPSRDEAWEAREKKFHEENIRQLNDLTRRFNTLAPAAVRRGIIQLERELNLVRGDVLRNAVWEGVKKRSAEILDLQARGPPRRSFLSAMDANGSSGTGFLGRLMKSMDRPIESYRSGAAGHGSGSGMPMSNTISSDGYDNHSHQSGGGGVGLLVLVGLGAGVLIYFKRPAKNEAPEQWTPIPLVEQKEPENEEFVAFSASEPKYGIVEFLRSWIAEPFLTFVRFCHLALLFGPVILTAPMIFVGSRPKKRRGKPVAEDEENWGAVWWYGFLVRQMQRAGPSFIKLGQWAASRADLFPHSLCVLMSQLHSSNKPHPFWYTKRVIEKAFGHTFEEIFDEFNKEPIGCGAIAQVYNAKLKPEVLVGNEADREKLTEELRNPTEGDQRIVTAVAIKVLHPRVTQLVRRDIAIMSIFANIINALPGMQWLSLPEEVQAFGDMMNQQLDLRVEASNLDRFAKNFSHRGKVVEFPKAIKINGQTAATKHVLIEEYEDALPLKYFLRNGGGPYDAKIANFGLDAFLEMLLLDNFTHGDLHPGNIMVRFIQPEKHIIGPYLKKLREGKKEKPVSPIPTQSIEATDLVHELKAISGDKEKWLARLDALYDEGYVPQLIFIDAGLVTSLNDKNRRDFLDLFQAVAEFDGYKAGKLMVERSKHPELALDEETFALKIQHLVLSVKSKTFSLAQIKISDILTDVLTAVRQHHVKLEGDFVNTVISILLLEGIGRQLDPDMDLFKSALPIMRQLGRQMSTTEALGHVKSGNIWAMLKLWVWAEARSVAGEASSIDQWVKYDWFTPSI